MIPTYQAVLPTVLNTQSAGELRQRLETANGVSESCVATISCPFSARMFSCRGGSCHQVAKLLLQAVMPLFTT